MGFELNSYDLFVMNKITDNKQCTVVWHMGALKVSLTNLLEVTNFLKHLSDKYGEMRVARGEKQTYVGMNTIYNDDKMMGL